MLIFVSLRDVRSLKAVCSAMLTHARAILRNAEWLSLHGASIGLLEDAGERGANLSSAELDFSFWLSHKYYMENPH